MTDYPFNADKPVKADTISNFCVYTEQNAEHLMRSLYGFVRRARFRWKDADEIYIGPGCYHHYGSTRNRLVWWNSELTFALGSGGSNAASDNVNAGAITWHYIYIDDSAVNSLASNELTAAEFLNDTTAPTWSDTYHGWYNGNDRCIGAVLASAANEVVEFYHDGGEMVAFVDTITNNNAVNVTTSFADATAVTRPAFCTKILAMFFCTYVNGAASLSVKPKGASGTTGRIVCASVGANNVMNTTPLTVDSDGLFQWKESSSTNDTYTQGTQGWYFPRGM